MDKPRLAFVPIARTTFDMQLAEAVTTEARANLAELALSLIGPDELISDIESAKNAAAVLVEQKPDLLLIFQATFADSTLISAFVDRIDAPLMLWAVPEAHTGGRLRLNSFCGINLAGHALTRAGYHYSHIFAPPDDQESLKKIFTLARAGRVRRMLSEVRLGRVGENPDGFETCVLNEEALRQHFGLQVVQYELEKDIFPRAVGIHAQRVDATKDQLRQHVDGLDDLDPTATSGTLGVYNALKDIAKQERLAGFAVRCWPEFFTELGCSACGAMSMLSDEGTPCSCEADINGTISQLILQWVSGEPAFGTDLVSLESELDAVVIWHCGLAPLSMADPAERPGTTVHSNRKLPLLFDFTLKPGRVTVARLSEASGEYRLVIGGGEMIRGPKSFSGTCGLLSFDQPAKDVLDVILSEGLEHHISITYGDHQDVLVELAQLLNIPVLRLSA